MVRRATSRSGRPRTRRNALDATKGMLQGKLKLKGDLPTIVRYTKASQEMTECTTRIPVEWPDETAS